MPPDKTNESSARVDLLILGAGWLYQFLPPLLTHHNLTHAATTTTGRDSTIDFTFNPDSPSTTTPYTSLPSAKTILITFPLTSPSQIHTLTTLYAQTHPTISPHYILLGSTSIYAGPHHFTDTSPPTNLTPRYHAEESLLAHSGTGTGTVLNLAGLHGEPTRDTKIWQRAVPPTKQGVSEKKSVHFVHGRDVARAVVAIIKNLAETRGEMAVVVGGRRWIVTDGTVYDWWELIRDAADRLDDRLTDEEREAGGYRRWVRECMEAEGVDRLPREGEMLGRRIDGSAFWEALGIQPEDGRFRMP